MIGGHDVVEDSQAISFLCFEQPLQPSLSILGELKKKLPLMTAMCDMPYLAGDVMTIRSWHDSLPKSLEATFYPQKHVSKPEYHLYRP